MVYSAYILTIDGHFIILPLLIFRDDSGKIFWESLASSNNDPITFLTEFKKKNTEFIKGISEIVIFKLSSEDIVNKENFSNIIYF